LIDTILDRSVVLGYGNTGSEVRRRLPGWPADPPRMDGRTVPVTGALLASAWPRPRASPGWALRYGRRPGTTSAPGRRPGHDRRPRPVTYLIGAGADNDATRQELWDHVAALAKRSQAGPA
jgi:hypothetical protein